jgi:hypothetical protein
MYVCVHTHTHTHTIYTHTHCLSLLGGLWVQTEAIGVRLTERLDKTDVKMMELDAARQVLDELELQAAASRYVKTKMKFNIVFNTCKNSMFTAQ